MASDPTGGMLTQGSIERECPVAACGFSGDLVSVYAHAVERAEHDARHGTVADDPERYLGAEPQAVDFW